MTEKVQDYLVEYFKKELTMPTVRQICRKFGWKSNNAAFKHLKVLEDVGVIRKHYGKYTLNPSIFHFDLMRVEEPDDSEYWRQKRDYYERTTGTPEILKPA